MRIKCTTVLQGLSLLELIILICLEYIYFGNAVGFFRKNTMVLQILVSILAIFISICSIRKTKTIRKSILSALVLVLVISFGAFLSRDFSLSSTEFLSLFLKTIYWFFVFIFGYTIALNFKDDKALICLMTLSLVFFIIGFMKVIALDYTVINKNYTITAIYYLICNAAFIFCLKNRRLAKALFIVVIMMTFLSFKRSALIVITITCIILIYENRKYISINSFIDKSKYIFFPLIIISILYFMFNGVPNSLESGIFNIWNYRFHNNNIRLMIQAEVLKLIYNTDLIHFIFGHGQNAVISATSLKLSAHNDFLEILYNYGVIGFIAFIVFIYYLFREKKRICRTCSRAIYNGYVYSLMVFLIASLPSHMITYGTYFLFLMLYIGFAIGHASKQES